MNLTADTDNLVKKGLYVVKGIPITVSFKKEFVEETLNYVPRDGDIIITSYPKTGTTWISYIVLQILTSGESFPSTDVMLNKTIPFMEMTGAAAVDALTSNPRVYKHHFPYDKVINNSKAKLIYIYRRPEDTFVSYFHFLRHNNKTLDFDQFFEDFLSGEISYGSYFDHVLSFEKHKDDPNVLFVSYESLSQNTKDEILRIAKFLGDEYYKKIEADEEVFSKIIEHTSFDYMKKALVHNATEGKTAISNSGSGRDASHLFRKGVIGEGKQSLKNGQLERLKRLTNAKMNETEILIEWMRE